MTIDTELLGALLDDAVLKHTGRSIGAIASELVAHTVLEELENNGYDIQGEWK